MNIESFINSEVPYLTPGDKIADALSKINDYSLTEVVVVQNKQVVALVKESVLLDAEDENDVLQKVIQNLPQPIWVQAESHPYEASVKMAEYDLNILPVVDNKKDYVGVVSRHDLFTYFFERTGLSRSGGIMILSLKPQDYSLAEIARICESNETNILNVQLFYIPNSEFMQVVLKTNRDDLDGLKAAFERYNYQILEIYGSLPNEEDILERYRLLMKYINM